MRNTYELLHYYINAFNNLGLQGLPNTTHNALELWTMWQNWTCICLTGCDSGFGHDLARFLDGAGMRVFAGVLDELSPGALELKKAASPNLTVLQLDITNSSQITQAYQYIQSQTGKTGEKTSLTYTGEEIWTISAGYNLIKSFDLKWMNTIKTTQNTLKTTKGALATA